MADAYGSSPVSATKGGPGGDDSVVLTRAQYYTRLALAFLAGAAVGGGAVLLLKSQAIGDEPPIRVRGGSMHFELLAPGNDWVSDTVDPQAWTTAQGTNGSEEYAVALKTSPGTSQCQNVPASARHVEVTYSDGATVTLRHTSHKSKVKGPSGLTKVAAGRLAYNAPGFISRIAFRGGGPPGSCQFTDASGLGGLCLCVGACPTTCQ